MSEDLVFAIFLLLAGTLFFGVGAYLILHQKVYYDPNNPNLTHVEIPIIGKLWTNVPAMALCFLGLYPIFLSSGQMQNRPPAMITFNGQVTLDKEIVPGSTVIIGLTDSSWSEPRTYSGDGDPIHVDLNVPATWAAYTAYAYAIGGPDVVLPDRQGANKEERTFSLNIQKLKATPVRTPNSGGQP
jgi:hypothetical protein